MESESFDPLLQTSAAQTCTRTILGGLLEIREVALAIDLIRSPFLTESREVGVAADFW